MSSFISFLINGISLGSVYAIIALGYTMVYGIAKMLNFAHGDVIMVGGYVVFVASSTYGLPIWLSIVLSVVVCTVLGITIERIAYKPLRGASSLSVLITAIGVSYFLQNAALIIFGADTKSFNSVVDFPSISLMGGKVIISDETIVTIVVCILVMVLLPSCGNRSARKAAAEAEATTLVQAGDKAPDFTVGMFDGSRVTLSDLRGKVVLLNFWATWCPPCREELARVQSDLIDRFAGRDFIFLPVSRGEARSAVETFRNQKGYDFPMGLDSAQSVYGLYATNFIPRNFLIDREGNVVQATIGYEPEEFDALIANIEKTLEK